MSTQDANGWEDRLEKRLMEAGIDNPKRVIRRLREAREGTVIAAARNVNELLQRFKGAVPGTHDATYRDTPADGETSYQQAVLGRLSDVRDRLVDAEARRVTANARWRDWSQSLGDLPDQLARDRHDLETKFDGLEDRLAEVSKQLGAQENQRGGLGQIVAFGTALALVSVIVALAIAKIVFGS